MLIKVVAVQMRLGVPLTLDERIHIFKQRPDFVCLPEYAMVADSDADHGRAALRAPDHLEYFAELSSELATCLIAGSIPVGGGSGLFNTSHVFYRGELIGSYRKRHLMPREEASGVRPGTAPLVLMLDGVRFAVLICADVFYADRFTELADEAVDCVFAPVISPFRGADSISQKRQRDQQYFVGGARSAHAYVVKAGGVGSIFNNPLQGRSLIAAPWGIVGQVDFSAEQERRILTATLDIDELREFRRKEAIRSGLGRTPTPDPVLPEPGDLREFDPQINESRTAG